jgi:hypothetical protein
MPASSIQRRPRTSSTSSAMRPSGTRNETNRRLAPPSACAPPSSIARLTTGAGAPRTRDTPRTKTGAADTGATGSGLIVSSTSSSGSAHIHSCALTTRKQRDPCLGMTPPSGSDSTQIMHLQRMSRRGPSASRGLRDSAGSPGEEGSRPAADTAPEHTPRHTCGGGEPKPYTTPGHPQCAPRGAWG